MLLNTPIPQQYSSGSIEGKSMNKELIQALEAIRGAVRVAQLVEGVDDALYGKLDELSYLVEDMIEAV
jgi:hypothetical protein